MTVTTAIDVLFGAALVAIGVLASALADRIRGIRAERKAQERGTRAGSVVEPEAPRSAPTPPKPEKPRAPRVDGDTVASDVVSALVAAGYKKPVATEAVWSCGAHERGSIELWTRAALRRCASGGPS